MKKLFTLALVAFAFASCDKIETPEVDKSIKTDYYTTSIKSQITLGDIEVVGGDAEGTHSNVFWAKSYGIKDDVIFHTTYDNLLFYQNLDNEVTASYGSYYTDYGGSWDTWNGFVISANFNNNATTIDYANQFSANAPDSEYPFLAAYYDGWGYGGTYSIPTIEFSEVVTPDYIYVANSSVTAGYYAEGSSTDAMSLVITGYDSDEDATASVKATLFNAGGSDALNADWIEVDLTSLGEVKEIMFSIESDDDMAPAYFCIDGITLK